LTEAEEAMSDIVWSVSPRHDTLESLLTRVRILTSDLCKANHIKYEVDFKGEEAHVAMNDDNRRSIYLIFKEAITNAARHSQATLIRVRVEMNKNVFTLHVQDDGKGMTIGDDPPGHLTKRGHGLRNMRKRAEEISAELSIQSAAGQGTAICLSKRMTQMGH
jgi:signal transduction histidine kinase